MFRIDVACPRCGGTRVIKYGRTPEGKQRYKCNNKNCKCSTFLLDYSYSGSRSRIEEAIIKMAKNGKEIRKTTMTLGVSTAKVLSTLKKQRLQ